MKKNGLVTALLVLGGAALVGGIIYAATRKSELPSGGTEPQPEPEPEPQPEPKPPQPLPLPPDLGLNVPPGVSKFLGVFSEQTAAGTWCDGPVIPRGVNSYEGKIREVDVAAKMVWAYMPPGGQPLDHNPVQKWQKELILYLVSDSVTPYGWSGAGNQVNQAKFYAPMLGGVARPNFIPEAMMPVMKAFAAKGVRGFPIIDATGKDDPVGWLTAVLKVWQWDEQSKYGAQFASIVPVLDVKAGTPAVNAMIAELRKRGISYMLISLQAIQQLNIECNLVEDA